MTRKFETECEHCGTALTVDMSDDPGADAYSVHAMDNYCGHECREADQ